MIRIPVRLSAGRSHEIRVGLPLKDVGASIKNLRAFSPAALVVSSAPVARRYARPLTQGLARAGFRPSVALMPDGEKHKTTASVARLYSAALAAGLDRRGVVVALGGGVVGDAAGFMAATYMRGVGFVQCPTTLLAMVDASIGGKTAVDLPEGKNLVGAFWQPLLVAADTNTLSTLPEREWRTGMAEVVKYGLIADKALFETLERLPEKDMRKGAKRDDLIARCAAVKASVVSRDERETKGLREILNFGHTFAHGIETVAGYGSVTHGEAVAVGMAAASRLARRLGRVKGDYVERVEAACLRWGLPVRAPKRLPREEVLAAMRRDKKNVGGRFRFVLPSAIGKVAVVSDVPAKALDQTLDEVNL